MLFARVLLAAVATHAALHADAGVGPLIDQRIHDLRRIAQPAPLPEIPNDFTAIPDDWLGLISWNVQVGGLSASTGAVRPPMVSAALANLFAGSYGVAAVQEVSSTTSAAVLQAALPASNEWSTVFLDSTDSQDNAFAVRGHRWAGETLLLANQERDHSGRFLRDPARSLHPPLMAHFNVGDFDFTAISLHLTYAGGDSEESAREMRHLLDVLDTYFATPGHDPDLIICGDFNLPTRLSGQVGRNGITLDSILEADPRFQTGERRLVTLVHEPTSRATAANDGIPRNNYDHFIVSADLLEELIQARRVDPAILTAHPQDPEERLTSDHHPIVAFFRTSGADIAPDVPAQAAEITSIVHGGSFEPGLTAGAWITIFGSGLAPATRTWRPEEIIDGLLPTNLDGVRVHVNRKPAAVYFISPGQLNVQAPDDDALGPVLVEVFHGDSRVASAPASANAVMPGFFQFDPLGRRFIAAVHPDGNLVGPADLFGGAIDARPARPGDVVLLFGTGFGATEPPVSSGTVFGGAAPLARSARVFFGAAEADVLFAGLSGAGLNQLNIVVPNAAANGDNEVFIEIDGVRSHAGAYIRIDGASTPTPPPTASINAIPSTITAGQAATLSWSTSNATTITINPSIGTVPASGSRSVSPTQDTTYSITASGPGGVATATTSVTVIPPQPTVADIVISQVYGGGGNQGATLANDFVELFNRGSSAVDLSGWTIQYASAGGDSWKETFLAGAIAPGGYFLVEQGKGQTGGSPPLPTPDFVDDIPMSNNSGKVALVASRDRLQGTAPRTSDIVDFVGYGSANFSEGATAPRIDNAYAVKRKSEGCIDTQDNGADFIKVSPAPRNSRSPKNFCP